MSHRVIADNWSLQNVAELLTLGLSASDAHVIGISSGSHHYNPLCEGIVQTEALFDLLTDIVLRDEITIDSAFTYTWDIEDNPLRTLDRCGILRRTPFLDLESEFKDLREHLVDRLCFTDSLKQEHAENVDGWNVERNTPNPLLSQVLWGGAGMFARSSVLRSSYCPHPLRRRFFLSAGLFLDGNSSYAKLNSVIDEKRLLVAKSVSSTDLLYSLNVLLPPIPIRIIEQSSTPSDFVKIALQIRPEFQGMRDWLAKTESAIMKDDLKLIRKQYEVLDDISTQIDSTLGRGKDSTSLSAGIGFVRFSKKVDPTRELRNRFGIRSILNKLILDSTGRSALDKYCKLFGESGTAIERTLQEHFTLRK